MAISKRVLLYTNTIFDEIAGDGVAPVLIGDDVADIINGDARSLRSFLKRSQQAKGLRFFWFLDAQSIRSKHDRVVAMELSSSLVPRHAKKWQKENRASSVPIPNAR